jgi:Flp pilus assembly protein TadG
VSDRKSRKHDSEAGAVLVEVTATILTFFVLIFGVIEFSYVFYQWNSATKSTERGARLAAVSSPVASNLSTLTGLEPANNLPGAAMPAFDCTCNGSTKQCTGAVPANATACTYNETAMKTILLGRGNDGTNCVRGANAGMCQFFPALRQANVVVRYQYTGMGYAGRIAGPIPTITVSLQNVKYEFLFLSGLANLTEVNFPVSATSTVTGEDLKATWSSS